jgi:hypothetical protein
MRTTIRINDRLLVEAKKFAAEKGKSLSGLIEDSLRESLARRGGVRKVPPVKLRTYKGKGLQPGVDLDDTASLLDLMDGGV